jgi:hypothetical protein
MGYKEAAAQSPMPDHSRMGISVGSQCHFELGKTNPISTGDRLHLLLLAREKLDLIGGQIVGWIYEIQEYSIKSSTQCG